MRSVVSWVHGFLCNFFNFLRFGSVHHHQQEVLLRNFHSHESCVKVWAGTSVIWIEPLFPDYFFSIFNSFLFLSQQLIQNVFFVQLFDVANVAGFGDSDATVADCNLVIWIEFLFFCISASRVFFCFSSGKLVETKMAVSATATEKIWVVGVEK